MTYYDVIEVYLDGEGSVKEKLVATKDSKSKANSLLEISKQLNPDKKYYISEDDSLDY